MSLDPSPCELIIIFSSNAVPDNNNGGYTGGQIKLENGDVTILPSRKTTALKLLALKVAATLKWDITVLEKG